VCSSPLCQILPSSGLLFACIELQTSPVTWTNINELLIHGKIVGKLLSILIREKPGLRKVFQALCI